MGTGAAIFVLALIAAIGLWTVVFSWTGSSIESIVATVITAFTAGAAFWITRRYQLSALWGILGALLGLLYPVIFWSVALIVFGLPEMD